MKIRNGFVSNSSSSSFILKKDSGTLDITAEELVIMIGSGINPNDFLIVSETYEGVDAFELSKDMGYLVNNYSDRFLTYGKPIINHIYYKIASFYPDTRSWNDSTYGKEEGLAEGESCLWVNYETIGSNFCYNDEKQFFKRYFLSTDEWDFVENAYDDDISFRPSRFQKTVVYSGKLNISENSLDNISDYDTIGFNEDMSCLDTNSIFTYRKLTQEDKLFIKNNKSDIKEGACLYKDFEILNKLGELRTTENKTYYITNIKGIFNKSKNLNVFKKKIEI